VVFGSTTDNFGSYLSWNHDNNALKLATAKTNGFIQLLTNNEAEAVRITSSGNVGIGATAPEAKLTVSGNISANGSLSATTMFTTGSGNVIIDRGNYRRNSDPTIIIGANSDQHLRFRAGGDTSNEIRMTILSSGEVGIGTTIAQTAAAKLTVLGNISASGNVLFNSATGRNLDLIHNPANDGTNPVLRVGEIEFTNTNAVSSFSGTFISYDETTNVFGISSIFAPAMGAPAIAIDRNSNVGIGTNAPSRQLNVALPSGNTEIAITTDSSSVASLYFGNPSTGDNRGQIRYYNALDAMAISTATQEAVRIRGGGQVGIGVTTPAEKLTVSGNISSNGTLYTTGITSRDLNLIHSPANDGTNSILRIGECTVGDTALSGFSGAFISYDEFTNTFGISSVFAPAMGIPAISIDRNGNFFTSSNASPKMTIAYAMTSANFLLSATNTISQHIPLFRVPSHVLYYVPGVDISFTVENFAGGNQIGTDQMPVFRLARDSSGASNQEMSVDITPFTNTNLYNAVGWNRQSINTQSGKTMALPGDTVYLKVKTGYNNTGGATTAYSILSGRVIMTGYYILP
jgi:hypothetical protein